MRRPPQLEAVLGPVRLRVREGRGRFPEEANLDVSVCTGGGCAWAFSVKVFLGRPPFYRGWAEVHSVARPELMLGLVEDHIVGVLASWLRPGETLYFEYVWDPVTTRELDLGVPPQATRLGYKMLMHGLTWMKDWYYPEGFMEGAPKIQAEKPVSPERATRHLREAAREAARILGRGVPLPPGTRARLGALLLLSGHGVQAKV